MVPETLVYFRHLTLMAQEILLSLVAVKASNQKHMIHTQKT